MSSTSTRSAAGGARRPQPDTAAEAKKAPYVLPPVGVPPVRAMEALTAIVSICAAGRRTAKIRPISDATGMEHRDIFATVKFLTATGLLTVSPAGWTPTVAGVRVAQPWSTDRNAGRAALAAAWRDSWVHPHVVRSIRPGAALTAEEIADALRPHKKARITPWVNLVDWLEMARYLDRAKNGTLRLAADMNTQAPRGPREDEPQQEPPSQDRQAPTQTPLGLVLPLTMDRLAELNADDYGAIMSSVATIYEVLSRHRHA